MPSSSTSRPGPPSVARRVPPTGGFGATEIDYLARVLGQFYAHHASLEEAFLEGTRRPGSPTGWTPSLARCGGKRGYGSSGHRPPAYRILFPSPLEMPRSPCKRLTLLVRWMVRDGYPDLGRWHRVTDGQLPDPPRPARALDRLSSRADRAEEPLLGGRRRGHRGPPSVSTRSTRSGTTSCFATPASRETVPRNATSPYAGRAPSGRTASSGGVGGSPHDGQSAGSRPGPPRAVSVWPVLRSSGGPPRAAEDGGRTSASPTFSRKRRGSSPGTNWAGPAWPVDSGPVGALVLLLEADRRGRPRLLVAQNAGRDPGFPSGALVAARGPVPDPRSDGPVGMVQLVELAGTRCRDPPSGLPLRKMNISIST